MPIIAIVNLVLFAALLSLLYQFSKNSAFTLSRRVFMGLIGGIVFGMYLQGAFGGNPEVMGATLEWTNVVANSYVALLRMMIMPLILITMIAAVLKVEEIKSLGQDWWHGRGHADRHYGDRSAGRHHDSAAIRAQRGRSGRR